MPDEIDTQAEPEAPSPALKANSEKRRRTPELEAALGARIRAARLAAKMSQTALGQALGISFQQVQKYELGKDRIAASTLDGIAAALGVHPGSFFGGETPAPTGGVPAIRGAMKVAADWQRIGNAAVRMRLAALISTIAGESSSEPASEA